MVVIEQFPTMRKLETDEQLTTKILRNQSQRDVLRPSDEAFKPGLSKETMDLNERLGLTSH